VVGRTRAEHGRIDEPRIDRLGGVFPVTLTAGDAFGQHEVMHLETPGDRVRFEASRYMSTSSETSMEGGGSA
jgi:hypothetical protein